MSTDALALEAVIGFSGNIAHSLILHPSDKHLIYPLGSTIVVRNVHDESDQSFLQGHTDRVTCLALSPDGTKMASGQITHMGYLADIILWDISGLADGATPKLLNRLSLHKVMVQALAFSCNGTYLASIGGVDDNNLVIWNAETGFAVCGSPAAHDTALTVTWLNNSEHSLVTGGIKVLRFWDLDPENRKVRPSEVNTTKESRTYTCLSISADDSTLYCGTKSGDVMVCSVAQKLMTTLTKVRVECGVTAMVLKGDELLLASGDGQLVTVSTKTLKKTQETRIIGSVSSISLDSTGDFFFAGTEASNIYLVRYDGLIADLKTTGHPVQINDCTFPAGYADLFATCAGPDIRIWHSGTMKELLRIQVPNLECNCIAFQPDGRAILSGWSDGKARAFNPQSGTIKYVINEAHRLTGVGNSSGGVVPKNGVTSICSSADCKRLLTGGADGQVRVWGVSKSTQVMIASMKEHKGPVYAISIKKDDTECVSASADGSCITWSLAGLHPFVRINALFAANFFKSAIYHPDESQLLTCGTDRKITYWDAMDMNAIRIVDGSETAALNSLDINGDGRFFVSGGSDKKVTLWNYDEGSKYYVGEGHSGAVAVVKISPDEKRIVTVGTEGGIFIWKVPDSFQAASPGA